MFIISWFLGTYGVDRFMLKDIKAGLAKVAVFVIFMIFYFVFAFSAMMASGFSGELAFSMVIFFLTGIMVFVFWLYDLCTVIKRTKEYNFMKMCEILNLTNGNTGLTQPSTPISKSINTDTTNVE